MKKELKKSIIQKAIELGFLYQIDNKLCVYRLPFGNSNELWVDVSEEIADISIGNIDDFEYSIIRKIESPEDLEMLFNAICPEKYRLPFN